MVLSRKFISRTSIVFALILISCMCEQGAALRLPSQRQPHASERLHFVWLQTKTDYSVAFGAQAPTRNTIKMHDVPVNIHDQHGKFGGSEFFTNSIFKDLDEETVQKLNTCAIGVKGDETVSKADDIHVWIIVNAEDFTGQQSAEMVSKRIGPNDRVLVLGNFWNATRKDDIVYDGRVTSMYIPFASLNFAERHRHTPMDLYDRSRVNFDREKKGILAYMQTSNCLHSIRDEMFTVLDEELRAADQPPGSALSACHGRSGTRQNGYVNEDGVNCDESCTRYDQSVGRYEEFRFVLSMEHDASNSKGPVLSTHGYITEKITNAFLAGAIPISDSTAERAQVFNKDSYIAVDATTPDGRRAGAKMMVELLNSEKWNHMQHQPSISEQSLRKFFSWHPAVWKSHGDFLRRQIVNEILKLCE